MILTKEQRQKRNEKNEEILKDLSKNTPFSELVRLEKENPWLLIAFWHKYQTNPNFGQWCMEIEAKELSSKPKKSKEEIKIQEKTIEPSIINKPVESKKETELERVERLLKEIEEKYK